MRKFNLELSLFYKKLVYDKTVSRAIRRALVDYLGLNQDYGLYRLGIFFKNLDASYGGNTQ